MIRKRFAFDQFHYQKRLALVFFDSMDGRNIWMVERRQQLRFSFETRQPLRLVNQRFGYELERHRAIEFEVACAVNLAHSTLADLLDDLVMGDCLADQKWASLSGLELFKERLEERYSSQ